MFLACLLAGVLAYSLPNTFVFMVVLLFVCLVPQIQLNPRIQVLI